MIVGIFEFEALSPGRWRVLNTKTRVSHVTYGTEEEVSQVLQETTAAWEWKPDLKKRRNPAWVDRPKGAQSSG